MNASDLIHSLLTGSWRLDREAVRETRRFNASTKSVREMLVRNHSERMRLYAGAEPGINRPYPNQLSTPEDWKQSFERIVLIRAARQLEEDAGFFDGILDDFENYVVGEELMWIPNTGNDEADRAIREFTEYEFEQADYQNRFGLTKLAQLTERCSQRDGEVGFVPVDVDETVKLRAYSGDCIGNPMVATGIVPTDFNGIIVDAASGQPVAYRLFKRLPKLNAYEFDRQVDADHFWHIYDPFRFQQWHGVTAFKNAIRNGFDIDQILEFTKLNIKFRASQLPTIHTENGKPRGAQMGGLNNWVPGAAGGSVSPASTPTAKYFDVDGVRINYLNTEEKVVDYPNDFPNAQLGISIEEFRRQCCKGAKLPYEFVYRADNGGVVQRFWVDKARNSFARRKYFLRRGVLNPYKNRVLKAGVESGRLDLRKFGDLGDSLALYKGQWQMGASISVDYGRETDADLKQIEAGVMSPVDFAASNNRDLDSIRTEIAKNARAFIKAGQQLAEETGLTFDQVMPFLVKKWPNPPAAITAAAAELVDVPERKGTPVPSGAEL
jgi:capsid protein